MRSNIKKEKIISKGAEASLYYGYWFGKEVIFKYRIPKKYRIIELDKSIRTERTLNEARALIKVKKYGINVPQVFEIDSANSTIVMKYIQGNKLKDILFDLDDNLKKKYFYEIGRIISILHKNGHIHGDITTSNIILTPEEQIFLIDFGLHEYSDTIEDKSVDLHLLKRVLISSHGKYYEFCFNAFLEGYRSEYKSAGLSDSDDIIRNIDAIETRGRYVKSEDRL
ncbi:MAG: Kae1-associated serine/threonine protein kinase [Candidatus Lokiarchaeota archaeon]|nr:Kae1-associated serine/threonine protein kinase [Candidatus Lokiarchaeota archaeon]